MKLFIKERPFSWDSEYDVLYENDTKAYHVKAVSGKKIDTITLYNRNEMELGKIERRKGLFGTNKFYIIFDGNEVGTIAKDFSFAVTRWILHLSRWRVFGLIGAWEYDILDEGCIIMHAGTEGTPYENCGKYLLDVYYDNNEINALLVVIGMEAANSLIKSKRK